ncbi:MAG: carboxypeptidase-like regulatory domain-containing protein [Candidatus Buchananbacteria bacterium]
MVFPTVTKTNTKIGLAITLTIAVIVSIGILIAPSFFPISQKAFTIPSSGCYRMSSLSFQIPSPHNSETTGACYQGTTNPAPSCWPGLFQDDEKFGHCRGRISTTGGAYTFCPTKSCVIDTTTVKPTIVIKSPSSGVSVALGSPINLVSEVRNDTTGKYGSVEWYDGSGPLKYGSSITYTFTTPGAKSVYATGGTSDDYIVSSKITINVTNPTGSQPGCCSYQRSDGPWRALNIYENVCLTQYPQGKWTPTCAWYRCKSTGGYESCSPYNSESCNLMPEDVASCGAGVNEITGQQNGYFKCNFTNKTCSSCAAGTAGCVIATDCNSACQISYPTYTCSGSPNYTCTQKVCTPGTPGCYSWIKDCTDVCNAPVLNWCVAGSTGGQCVASATKPAGTILKIFSTASACSLNCPSAVSQATGCCTQTSYLLGSKTSMTTKSLCKPNLMYPRAVTFIAGKTCTGALINEVDLCLNVPGTQSVSEGWIQDSFGNCTCSGGDSTKSADSCPVSLNTVSGIITKNNERDFYSADVGPLEISGAKVTLLKLLQPITNYGPATTDVLGKYSISNVPSGSLGIQILKQGFVTYCGKVNSPNSTADFKLYPLVQPNNGGDFDTPAGTPRPAAASQLGSGISCLYNKLASDIGFDGYSLRFTSLGRSDAGSCHNKTSAGTTQSYAVDVQAIKDNVNKLQIFQAGDAAESNRLCKSIEAAAKSCKFTTVLDERNGKKPSCQTLTATASTNVHVHLSVCNCDTESGGTFGCTATNSLSDYTCSF